jgi:hypothetical protein
VCTVLGTPPAKKAETLGEESLIGEYERGEFEKEYERGESEKGESDRGKSGGREAGRGESERGECPNAVGSERSELRELWMQVSPPNKTPNSYQPVAGATRW